MIHQEAPDPIELRRLVDEVEYRPEWRIRLIDDHDRGQGSIGMTLDVVTHGFDSYNTDYGETYRVHHYFPVPPASYNRNSWQRWLFNCLLLVERHEAMEFFVVAGERPYAPNHGPGHDPYVVRELASDEERRTSFRGDIKPSIPGFRVGQ